MKTLREDNARNGSHYGVGDGIAFTGAVICESRSSGNPVGRLYHRNGPEAGEVICDHRLRSAIAKG
ncbi:hypothetical protein EHW66_16295 [Erwinia psidii]|nr:hypothetical protein [Erwinia psidii]